MNYQLVQTYIEDLYKDKGQLTQKGFVQTTQMKDFIPVVDDDVARMLQFLIASHRPMHILEIGTSIGYSATSMAFMLKEYGGKITTIEYDKTVAKQAMENFERAGVADCIEVLIGDALDIVPKLDQAYDMIFQDVDKHLYPKLYEDCIRLLKPNGILLAEDTLFPVIDLEERWHDLIPPIKEFNQLVTTDPRMVSTLLPIGDGLIVATKQH